MGQVPIIEDPNSRIAICDIHPAQWVGMPMQVQVMVLVHTLIDFMGHPAFHQANGIRVQVKEEGMLVPNEVVTHLGNKGTLQRTVTS